MFGDVQKKKKNLIDRQTDSHKKYLVEAPGTDSRALQGNLYF